MNKKKECKNNKKNYDVRILWMYAWVSVKINNKIWIKGINVIASTLFCFIMQKSCVFCSVCFCWFFMCQQTPLIPFELIETFKDDWLQIFINSVSRCWFYCLYVTNECLVLDATLLRKVRYKKKDIVWDLRINDNYVIKWIISHKTRITYSYFK